LGNVRLFRFLDRIIALSDDQIGELESEVSQKVQEALFKLYRLINQPGSDTSQSGNDFCGGHRTLRILKEALMASFFVRDLS